MTLKTSIYTIAVERCNNTRQSLEWRQRSSHSHSHDLLQWVVGLKHEWHNLFVLNAEATAYSVQLCLKAINSICCGFVVQHIVQQTEPMKFQH